MVKRPALVGGSIGGKGEYPGSSSISKRRPATFSGSWRDGGSLPTRAKKGTEKRLTCFHPQREAFGRGRRPLTGGSRTQTTLGGKEAVTLKEAARFSGGGREIGEGRPQVGDNWTNMKFGKQKKDSRKKRSKKSTLEKLGRVFCVSKRGSRRGSFC